MSIKCPSPYAVDFNLVGMRSHHQLVALSVEGDFASGWEWARTLDSVWVFRSQWRNSASVKESHGLRYDMVAIVAMVAMAVMKCAGVVDPRAMSRRSYGLSESRISFFFSLLLDGSRGWFACMVRLQGMQGMDAICESEGGDGDGDGDLYLYLLGWITIVKRSILYLA